MIKKQYILGSFCASIFLAVLTLLNTTPAGASETNGSILGSTAYAWGDKLSWINFNPTGGGITITDTALNGYAWSQNDGWINFAPTNGGVTNTTEGQLGGNAWSSGKGWISFSGITISAQGKFSGIAGGASTTAGQINFDCTSCNVLTDWRPLSVRTNTTPSSTPQTTHITGGSFSASPGASPLPHITISEISPLELMGGNAGKLTLQTITGPVTVEVPQSTNKDRIRYFVSLVSTTEQQDNPPIPEGFLLNAASYDIRAIDNNGNEVHNFDPPLRITLPLPPNLKNIRRLGVYWFDTTTKRWNKIPNAVFYDDRVVFTVSHLTRFAIFATRSNVTVTTPAIVQSPGGGAIVTEKRNVDISLQQQSVRIHRGYNINPSTTMKGAEAAHASTVPKPYDVRGLYIATVTLIALLVFLLAKRKIKVKK